MVVGRDELVLNAWMGSSSTIELTYRAMLSPVDEHRHLLSASPGPDGRLATLWVTSEGGRALSDAASDEPVTAMVIEYDRDIRTVVPILELSLEYPSVQILPDGRVLIVGARCQWRPAPDGPEHNAALHDPEGNPQRTGVLGDGIEHVQASSDGRIWVGYFDEGVFGNYGWGDPGVRPIGAPGLICFDDEFEPVWKLEDPEMADCYALNVDEQTAWACYYTDFPIVRIDHWRPTSWDNEVAGARAILVSGDRIALLCGYGGDAHHVRYGRLDGHRFRVEDTGRLLMPDGEPPHGVPVHGRGDTVHVIRNSTWYAASLPHQA